MKKGNVLNSELSYLIARLGHTDAVAVVDAGLPIASTNLRIDLALMPGVPTFMQVVEAVTEEMQVEKAVIAQEMIETNPAVYQILMEELRQLQHRQGNRIAIEHVSHEQFKVLCLSCKGIVRSGECSPYANVLFYSGVTF